MVEVLRTPDERFSDLAGWNFEPSYLEWEGLRLHYVDQGPTDGPVVLLLHGEPTWSYLYRGWFRRLVAAGFRCVAPDFIGFGRSDKVLDESWYVIERHVESLRHLIITLGLQNISLVCQDWGGPIGLRQAVDMPDRFARLFIMNTWLHHDGFAYSDGMRTWHSMSQNPDFARDLPTGRIVAGTLARKGHDIEAVNAAYDAPFPTPESKAGARRFPWCLPFAQPEAGGARWQQLAHDRLLRWDGPIHLVWGDADPVFTWEWAEAWASRLPGATLDRVAGASHFVQEDATDEVVDLVLSRLGS
ncbi:MAG: haloalkane dehalogenase [Acidimicrobiales bacterium]